MGGPEGIFLYQSHSGIKIDSHTGPGGFHRGFNLAGDKQAGGLGESNAKNGDQQEYANQYDGELEQCPLHSSSGAQGILGGAKQSAATLPHLHQDEQYQHTSAVILMLECRNRSRAVRISTPARSSIVANDLRSE